MVRHPRKKKDPRSDPILENYLSTSTSWRLKKLRTVDSCPSLGLRVTHELLVRFKVKFVSELSGAVSSAAQKVLAHLRLL